MRNRLLKFAAVVAATCTLSAEAQSQDAFVHGWTLDGSASHLNFITVKNGSIMEASNFAKLEGSISEEGRARFDVLLDSIDTKVDLRNVRMRFLMFETFIHPKASVTAELTPEMLEGLAERRSMTLRLPIELDLHGVTRAMEADVAITLADRDNVSVTSVRPIVLALADFGLLGGIEKLQDAAEVRIVPTTAITFGLNFRRNGETAPMLADAGSAGNAAIEPLGAFDSQACQVRFDTLSRSGNIHFAHNSSVLESESAPLLESVAYIVERCPDLVIEVAGHTDSFGNSAYNMQLSRARAQSVVDYLAGFGLSSERFVSRGYGETRPVASNSTNEGRGKNRRIEFSVIDRTANSG